MKKALIIAASILLAAAAATAQETQTQAPTPQNTQEIKDAKYTNDSIARLSFIEGKAFVQRASDLGYEEAALNMPISEGDRIGTSDGRVEIHFGKGNYLRLDSDTKVDVLNLPKKDDDIARLRVWSGHVFLVVGTLKKEKGIELHTADSSFYVLDRGIYRVDVRENRDTEILVYKGLIEAAGEDGSTLLKASQRLEIAEGRLASKPSSFIAVADDDFDKFNESRTSITGRELAKGRLPEDLSDYEGELDENGRWTYLAPYGDVWMPNDVGDDWRPYYNGRWTWLPLSGWTWWPYDSWGWATFHYGRWHWAVDLGWYWIPMSLWGPAWVDWWWDDMYFGWAPLSYWGYPGVIMGGAYYGHYYGPYYPYDSRALTVVRRDHLKDPHIAANALRGDSLKGLNRISLTHQNLGLRPAGSKISVEPINGNRVMLRNDRSTGLERDARVGSRSGAGGKAAAGSPRAIRKPDEPSKGQSGTKDASGKASTVKSPAKGKGERSSGSTRSSGSGGRNIRKKDGGSSSASAALSSGGYRSDPSIAGSSQAVTSGQRRTAYGYPSSPSIKGRASSYGDGGSGRSRTYSGPYTRSSSSGSYARPSSSGRSGGKSVRSGGSSSSGSRSGSSGRSSGGSSRGGSSRSSGSSSRGSSSGSRGSSGGSAHRK
ncbi:MAG TPA: FecR domain-containing protein [Candidatus Aminicenantes bacterium]|nr:FecR domain-containing protein [Candidatus Aminicenantes bacterium]HRY65926.1 FecR domain-containing protein [Candidatus Aminicenantes bacterium]HRZ72748.1 FecR domain-containing protein [Candidatus Aminicenantes bacterium]